MLLDMAHDPFQDQEEFVAPVDKEPIYMESKQNFFESYQPNIA